MIDYFVRKPRRLFYRVARLPTGAGRRRFELLQTLQQFAWAENRGQPLNRGMLVNMERHTFELCVAVTEEGALVVATREQGLRRARALLGKYVPGGVNLSDELIADRRSEAAREAGQRQ